MSFNALKKRSVLSEEFQVTYVDFYNETDISPDTADVYLNTDGVHPNNQGFEQMSNCMVRLLKDRYGRNDFLQ